MDYEYRVIPAPKRLKRRKGVSSSADLLAQTLTECINAEAASGWEYLRTEQLAAEEPAGWFRRGRVVEETLMVFRRPNRAERREDHAPREQETGPRNARPTMRQPLAATRREPEPQTQPERRPLTPRGSDAAPPLLRPVPRFTPGDKT